MSDDIKDPKIKLRTFTSTGLKILKHPEVVSDLNKGIPRPVSLQVAMNETCQLDCLFCSVKNRGYNYNFEWPKLKDALSRFFKLGVKTVEFSVKGDELVPIKENSKVKLLTIKEVVEQKKGKSFTLNNDNKFDEGLITDFIEHPQTEPLYKITLDDGRNITVTKSHSIFFYENNEVVYKKISDAKIGDVVVLLSKNPEIIEEKLDNDFCRLLGYFTAEGSYSWQREKVPHGVHFTFGLNERYVGDVCNILEKLGYTYFITERESSTQIHVTNKKLCEEFLALKLGVGSKQKRVPDAILNSTFENKIEFLKGLFAGDGTFRNTKSRKWNRNQLQLKTASKIMTQTIGYLLDNMDIWYTINQGKSPKRIIEGRELPEGDYYTVDISARKDLEKMEEVVKFKGGTLTYANSKYSCHDRFKKRIEINSDCFGVKIKKIEAVSPEEKVYDLSVKGTHRFEGSFRILCHNTGGGDPLLYSNLNDAIEFTLDSGKKCGIITNGIGINKKLDPKLQARMSWIRISSNTLDYRDHLDLPENMNPEGNLGFSYCWTENLSTESQLLRIKDIALQNNVKYIRLVPNCLDSNEDMLTKWDPLLKPLAEKLGHPFFYQPKNFGSPPECYLGYVKPFLYADEYVYPCSSTVLNPEADEQFNPAFRWYHYDKMEAIYSQPMSSIVDTKRCPHCVFTPQNQQLQYIINSHTNEEFF